MRTFNYFSLMIMTGVALFTWSAVAAESRAEPQVIHLLENLSKDDLKIAHQWIKKKGYKVSQKSLFSASSHALVITRTIATESDLPSIQIEMMSKENHHDIPKTTFTVTIPTEKIAEAFQSFPNAEKIASTPQPSALKQANNSN